MVLVVAILLALTVLDDPWPVPVVLAAVVWEIITIPIWIRISRRDPPRLGPETLAGTLCEVIEACRPNGVVRMRGEQWSARCDEGADLGELVRVRGREGLVLLVDPVQPDA
jgi:membrane protein implicated in regulation of membrane protease activity